MNSMSHRRLEISVSKFELVAWVALVAAAVYCLMQAGLNVVA